MESRINKLKNIWLHSGYKWMKLLAITGSAQILVQGLGLLSGILIIRLMPVREYAWYTIANTMLGTLTVLSDGGISTGVMAEGGKVWQDKEKLGIVLVTGMQLRRKFAIGSLMVSIPILLYLLIHQQASWLTAILIALSLIPAFYAALSDNLLEIPLKLHQQIFLLQKNQVQTSLGRLVLITGALMLFPFPSLALLGNGLPRLWANEQLKKYNKNLANYSQNSHLEIRKKILKLVWRLLPGAIYYCVSGQLTIWLISLFGSTSAVTQLGGLGRLAVILTLLSTMFNTLITPFFAKLTHKATISVLIRIQLTILLSFPVFIFATYLMANQLLWLLGNKFNGLKTEILLSMCGSYMGLMAGCSFSLFTARGWAMQPFVVIPINILSIIIALLIFKVDTIKGVLFFSIFIGFIQYAMNTLFCFYKSLKY